MQKFFFLKFILKLVNLKLNLKILLILGTKRKENSRF